MTNIKMKKWYMAAAMAVTLGLVGCNNDNASGSQSVDENKDTLVVALSSDAPTLDPDLVGDTTSSRVVMDLFEGLVMLDQANNPVPGVAKSWDISEDGKTYTFHLRDNAKWSNGEPVTAQAFVYGLKRELDPATGAPNNTMYSVIKNGKEIMSGEADPNTLGIKAINDTTLEISLDHPAPYLLDILVNAGAYPVYIPAVEKNPKGWAQAGTLVSNGAYTLKEWVPNGHILLEKNPNYWDKDNVKIEKVKFLPIPNPSDALNQYKSDQVDITQTVPSGLTAEQYRKMFGDQFINVTQLSSYFYVFNVNAEGVDAVNARKALTMVIDRKAIINSVLRMGQVPIYGLLPVGIQGGEFDGLYKKVPGYEWVNKTMEQRVTQAKSLLESLGYSADKPLEITISYNTDPAHQQIAEVVMQMWKTAFGDLVQAKLLNEEWKVYLQTLQKHNFQVARLGWSADYSQASNFLDLYTCNSSNNNSGICDQSIENNYDMAMNATNQEDYNAYIGKALVSAMKQYPALPLYSYTYSRLVKPYIGGYNYENNHLDVVYSKWLYFKTDDAV